MGPARGGLGMGGLGGLGMLLPLLGRFGWRGILIVVGLIVAMQFLECPGGGARRGAIDLPQDDAAEDELVGFVGYVFDDVQGSWADDFAARGASYQPARIVVYRQAVSSRCGTAPSSVGPFYCPLDGKVYIDLSFYDELHRRFGAPGDFAQAYVIGHEIGHHIQHQIGTLDSRGSAESVKVELQADCLAGAWARDADRRGLLEPGDLREALAAAAAIGDDRIQARSTGRIHRDSFTHGSSAQREAAFRRGYDVGTLDGCGL
jgi:uncharacterized protein